MNNKKDIEEKRAEEARKNKLVNRLRNSKGIKSDVIKKILIPTDFSDVAHHAAAYAIRLAKTHDAEIIMLHTYQFFQSRNSVIINVDDVISKSANSALSEEIELFQKQHPEVTITGMCQENYLSTGINYVVKEKGIDLIVMGTKGTKGTARNFLGSNTSNLLSEINIPILVIPSSTIKQSVNNVFIASDLREEYHDYTFNMLGNLVSKKNSHLHILNIISEKGDINEQKTAPLIMQLKEVVKHSNISVNHAINNNIELGIQNYLDNNIVDLLVVVKKQRGMWRQLLHKSVSEALVKHAATPILVLSQ